MSEPEFLALDEVLALHADLIRRYGGSTGLRDLALLQSALAMPEASYGGERLHGSLFEMAAAYLFHLARNHPFVDGNKRVGAAATLAFLHMNGYRLEIGEPALVKLVLGVASGKVGRAGLADFLRAHCRKA